ncbi:extracellular agarase [Agaribacter marinus]|uniref:Extracellular agarase n=1 Tax=Agaribacter marinus TaxID=1431249 RepID=A0AA37WLA0_9ALTE|nr:extracellular agarase [Agaribacter marinus]
MRTPFYLIALSLLFISACETAVNDRKDIHDWQDIPLPDKLNTQHNWQLVDEVSDSFNYQQKSNDFNDKWHDNHIRGWKGPGATYFDSNHSAIENGKLVLSASPVPESQQGEIIDYGDIQSKKTIFTGFVTAKTLIKYPIYVEASLKVSKFALASNFWMLSDDDVYEIDVTETYGDTEHNAKLMATNYHIFVRDPVTNDYLQDNGHKPKHHKTPTQDMLNEDYHRFGFYWKSPTHMEFYLDGSLIRTLSTDTDLTDPDNNFFNTPMRIIFDMEDHVWRAKKGITPTKEELIDPTKNRMYVDWIRAYQPTS